jgi:hypothetical protein
MLRADSGPQTASHRLDAGGKRLPGPKLRIHEYWVFVRVRKKAGPELRRNEKGRGNRRGPFS